MPDTRVYPKHIYDPIRIEIATSYAQHEMRKLLRHAPESYWKIIDKDIAEWINSPELSNPRDFWNGIHGISTGFKLKGGLISLITAENVEWKKTDAKLESLQFGVTNKTTLEVGSGNLTAKEVKEFYLNPDNKKLFNKHLKISNELAGATSPRDHHPIIAIAKEIAGKNYYSVFDGNRRLTKSILDHKETISAYLGTYTTEVKLPTNYWLPTSILMDIVREGEFANDYETTLGFLRSIINQSESGKYELRERVLVGDNKFRMKLKEELFRNLN